MGRSELVSRVRRAGLGAALLAVLVFGCDDAGTTGRTGAVSGSELEALTDPRADLTDLREPVSNAVCPVYTQERVGPTVAPARIVEFDDERIGMCCDECVLEWAAMSDAQRRSLILEMRRLEAQAQALAQSQDE